MSDEYEYELYHHGVKGMKWGIRRFKKRVTKSLKKAKKKASDIIETKKAENEAKKKASRSVKELTDTELRERANRLRLEKDVLDLERQVSSLTPKQVSTGEKFAKVFEDTVVPAFTKVGKDYLEKALRDATGLNDKKDDKVDPLKDLRESTNRLKLESESAGYRKKLTEVDDFYTNRKAKADKNKQETSQPKKQEPTSGPSNKKQEGIRVGKKMVEDTFSKSISELESGMSKKKPPIDMDMELRDLLWF